MAIGIHFGLKLVLVACEIVYLFTYTGKNIKLKINEISWTYTNRFTIICYSIKFKILVGYF